MTNLRQVALKRDELILEEERKRVAAVEPQIAIEDMTAVPAE